MGVASRRRANGQGHEAEAEGQQHLLGAGHFASVPKAFVAAGVGWFRPAMYDPSAATPATMAGTVPAVRAAPTAPPTMAMPPKIFIQIDVVM